MYLFFGIATTSVNFIIYTVFVKVLQVGMTSSNAVAWLCAVIFAFITNKLFVFESRRFDFKLLLKESVSFFGARIVSGIVEIALPTLLYNIGFDFELFGIKGFAAKAFVSVIVIILNYVFSKLFVFKNRGKKSAEQDGNMEDISV